MEAIILGVVLALFTVGGGVFLFAQEKGTPRSRKLLAQLGLYHETQSDNQLPFYRWGWHEEDPSRISAEQMVRDAFRKEGLWLNSDDLHFFKMQCENNIHGVEVDTKEIEKRVDEIASRSEILMQWSADQVRAALEFVSNLSPEEAQEILLKSEIKSDVDAAQSRLLALEIKRQLCRIGLQILGPKASGCLLNETGTGKVILLQTVEAWKRVLTGYKDEMERLLNQGRIHAPAVLQRALKLILEKGVLRDYLQDIDRYSAFRKRMMSAIQQREISVAPDRIAALDAIFYHWKFTEGIRFEQEDHDRLRELLIRSDLTPRFREIVIDKIDAEIRSVSNLARMFSRKVLFYGGSKAARAFAADQYSRHLAALLDCIADMLSLESAPPIMIEIPQEEIETVRRAPKRGAHAITLDQVMEKHQRIVMLRESISTKAADKRGWIIHLALNEPMPEEIEAIRREPFNVYTRFNCDNAGDVDFLNNTYNAKKSRVGFFNMVIDCMVEIPAIPRQKPTFGAPTET